MPYLFHEIEKLVKHRDKEPEMQKLVLKAKADKHGNVESYDDVEARLFVKGHFIADISYLLSKAGVFTQIVDSVDWAEKVEEVI
jgi:hypothetical protein